MTDGGNPRKEERIAYTGQKEKLSMNAWHQLTFTLEGNVGTLYVDGVKAEVKSDYTTNPSKLGNTIENYIGKPTWADPYFNGYIDEFQVYDYALSEEEVYAIHDSAAQQLVQADVEALDLGDTGGVMEDLNLPSVGINGSAITWKSSNPKYLDDTGKVTRPASGEGNVTVTLTATIFQGEFSGTKDFEVVILSEDFAFSQEDPYLHYTFDDREGSKIASNSGKGGRSLSASINGGTVEWTNGLFQGAAKLSSNGHFKMPDGVVKDLTDFTLSTWVYIDEQLSNQTVCTFARGTEQYLILTTQRGNMEQGVSLVMTSGEESSGDHTEKEQRISYTAQKEKLSANAWHHIAFTLEGSVGVLYVDGVKAEVKSDFTTNPSKLGYTVDNYIGRPTWPDPYLTGMVDDFRIYDYALTEEEIYEISSAADPALVKEDAEKLDLGDTSAVTQDLNLPTQGQSGSAIRWTSSNPLYLSDSGVVHRPDAGSGSVEVTLTASVSKGSAEPVTRDFVITILDMSVEKDDLNVFSMETGNPTVPAYLADASFYYDENTETFYAYGTNDGAGGGNVFPTQMWYSKDCKNWKNEIVELPKSWTDYAGTSAVWAPSIAYSPQTEKYYLMYGIDCKTFIAMSDSPMGPWEDANSKSPGNLLYVGYDGQFFVDDDGQMYITTDSGEFKIMKLAFDEEGKVLIDGSDPRFDRTGQNEFIGEYKYAQVTTIRNSFEASFIYKRDGLYYLMWSFNGSENYNVRYAVSENITGPYREINDSMDVPILQRDDDNNILGPGHHSVFDYNGRTFIAYHRQHYPFVDSKRQTCIEELIFNEDKSIQTVKPTHMGTVVAEDPQEEKENIALGKQTKVSSAREYDNSENPNRYRTTDISFRYEGNFAVDENNGTRWEPVLGSRNPWLIVDLGSD